MVRACDNAASSQIAACSFALPWFWSITWARRAPWRSASNPLALLVRPLITTVPAFALTDSITAASLCCSLLQPRRRLATASGCAAARGRSRLCPHPSQMCSRKGTLAADCHYSILHLLRRATSLALLLPDRVRLMPPPSQRTCDRQARWFQGRRGTGCCQG